MVSDYKWIAFGGTAVVEDQVSWAGETTFLANGFPTGIVDPLKFNKAFRQATGPGAAITYDMTTVLGQNVLDDGVIANLAEQFWESQLMMGTFADSGSSNTIVIVNPLGLTFPLPKVGTRITVRIAATNTGPSNLNWMSHGNSPITYTDGSAIQAGDLIGGGYATFEWDGTNWQLLSIPTSAGTGAGALGNIGGYSALRLTGILTVPATSLTLSADNIAVATALGGKIYGIPAFNKTLDTTITGVGGMDTGLAPVSGFLSVYAIYNPTTKVNALLGTVAGQTTVYNGVNMPAGFTASALLGIWPTNGTRQMVAGTLVDRVFNYSTAVSVLSSGSATVATAISLSAAIPMVARRIEFMIAAIETGGTITANSGIAVGNQAANTNIYNVTSVAPGGQSNNSIALSIATPQTMYYRAGQATMQTSIVIYGYSL